MPCPSPQIIAACDFPQFLVDQTPKFDELIMQDIRPTDGWILNVSTGTVPMGTPVEITQDRFRSVFPNTTKQWQRVKANGPGCTAAYCDPTEHQIGWGADRLTYYAEQQTWATPLICYDQDMHITHARQHLDQIIHEVCKPATLAISSSFLRKRHLAWSKVRWAANSSLSTWNYQWTLGGVNGDDEMYLDASVAPANIFKMAPQMLQNRYIYLMMRGYAGHNPFTETSPFISCVTDMENMWELEHLGGQLGVGGGDSPNVYGNWRFTEFNETTKYWRFGFSGQIGNYLARLDPMNLRFNFVADLGASANGGNGNRYRYQIVLPYVNTITTGAGGSAGLGDDVNPDFINAHFRILQIDHKKGMELLVPDAKPLNPDMPFGHRDFGGKWRFMMHDLGADATGAISNKWENKGQFGAWFKYYVRPLHYEFMEAALYQGEQFCMPQIPTCSVDPGYPAQTYSSTLPNCPIPAGYVSLYGTGVPTGSADGPVPAASSQPAGGIDQ